MLKNKSKYAKIWFLCGTIKVKFHSVLFRQFMEVFKLRPMMPNILHSGDTPVIDFWIFFFVEEFKTLILLAGSKSSNSHPKDWIQLTDTTFYRYSRYLPPRYRSIPIQMPDT